MTAFTIEHRFADWFAIMHEGRRVAILTPARPANAYARDVGSPWSIILDPEAFPDVPATNLPWPLRNTAMSFNSFADVAEFLGVEAEEIAA